MEQRKWEGKVTTSLKKATADQIWPLFKDFFNLHKYFPILGTCYGIHGTNGEPGCIRYCTDFSLSSNGSSDDQNSPAHDSFAKERLISVDEAQRSLCYEIGENNIGFNSYVSSIKIVPGDDDGRNGCVIEWSFKVDPIEGVLFADFVKNFELWLQLIAKKMEDVVLEV